MTDLDPDATPQPKSVQAVSATPINQSITSVLQQLSMQLRVS